MRRLMSPSVSMVSMTSMVSMSSIEMEEGLNDLFSPNFSNKYPKVITLNQVNYSVIDNVKKDQQDSKRKTILKDISFYVKPGTLVLVLGAPGGGRSSLFKVMANHTAKGSRVDGDVLFGGKHVSPAAHHRQVAYITQQDNHLPSLTVRETLWFSSECSHGPSDKEDQSQRLDFLLKMLGLKHVEDTFVGNQFLRGISGGQKKRVTIGLDLLKGASVLLMDEPTTGLDSVTVVELMQCVQSLARQTGISVVCTLLQPPAEVLPLFDNLLLLNEGQVSYFGPMNEAHPYFNKMGFVAPPDTNEAEFFQEVVTTPSEFVADGSGKLQPGQPSNPSEFAQVFRESDHYRDIVATINENQLTGAVKEIRRKRVQTEYVNAFWRQTYLCCWRAWKIISRDRMALYSRFLTTFLIGFYFGVSFLFSDNSQWGIENKQNLLFISSMYTLYSTMLTLEDLYNQRAVFIEQRDARKWYKTLPYFIAYSSTEIVLGFLQCLLLCVEMYWLAGLSNGEGRFIYFLLNHYLLYISNFAILFATQAVTSTAFYPGVIIPFIQMLFLEANGFVIPRNKIKGWWIWLYWISPGMYSFEGMMINEFGGGKSLTCEEDELLPPTSIAVAEYQGSQICLLTEGEQLLTQKGYHTDFSFRWVDLAILIAFTAVFLLFAFIAILLSHQTASGGGASGAVVVTKKKKNAKKSERLTNHFKNKTGCPLTFTDISYYVPTNGTKLQLLNKVSGFIEPGKILALMGPSGAGKSTLLDVLAQRKRKGTIQGEILIGGRIIDDTFHRRTAYVMQTDVLHSSDTVREVVRFSAACRLPNHHSESYKNDFAEGVMKEMKLEKIANEIVVNLSPEQRKRVNIAVELAANPQILFLDEPTSGLDSAGARTVMKCIYGFSRRNSSCSIICTIHQPSEEIFSLFDSLLLLATGGHTVYFGPLVDETGSNRNGALLEYCKNLGYNITPKANPADFVLAFAAAKPSAISEEWRIDTIEGLQQQYEKSTLSQCNLASLQNVITASLSVPIPPAPTNAYFITQTLQCLYRATRGFLRRRTELMFHIGRPIFIGFFLGTLFLRLGNDQQGASERSTLLYFSMSVGSLVGYTMIPTCAADRAVFYREKDSGTYHPLALCIAHTISGAALNGVVTILFAFPIYWLSGMDPNDRFTSFLFFTFTNFIGSTAFVTVGQLLAVALPSPGAAAVAFTIVENLATLYAGYLIKQQHMVKGLKWLRHIAFFKYSVESTAVQLLSGVKFYCKESEYLRIPLPNNTTKEYCPYTEGEQILEINGFEESWKWPDIGILLGQWFVLMVIFLIVLKKIRYD